MLYQCKTTIAKALLAALYKKNKVSRLLQEKLAASRINFLFFVKLPCIRYLGNSFKKAFAWWENVEAKQQQGKAKRCNIENTFVGLGEKAASPHHTSLPT